MKTNYHSFLDSPQAILYCRLFLRPTSAVFEAVLSSLPGYSHISPGYLSLYIYCSRYRYRFFWRHWLFCQENAHHSYLRSLDRQQETTKKSQKLSCSLLNPCDCAAQYKGVELSFILTMPISIYNCVALNPSLSSAINFLFLSTSTK